MRDPRVLLEPILAMHDRVRDEIVHATERAHIDALAAIDHDTGGVIVTDPRGATLDAPLNVDAEVAWVGYANARIRAQIEPLLQQELRARGWIDSDDRPSD